MLLPPPKAPQPGSRRGGGLSEPRIQQEQRSLCSAAKSNGKCRDEKLRLDCVTAASLLDAGGANPMQKDDCNALTSALLALLTAKFEDAAAFAMDGQAQRCAHVADLVGQVRRLTDDAMNLVDAIEVVNNSGS